MADRADELTLEPVPVARPGRRDQARPHPGQRRRPRRRASCCAPSSAGSRPSDRVVGEEYGGDRPDLGWQGRRWILDPIDGTKNYVRGVPVWATLIALVDGRRRRGRRRLGTGARPPLVGRPRRRRLGRRRLARTLRAGSTCPRSRSLDDASLSYSDAVGWPDGGAAFADLAGRCWRTRAYGDFWSHVLVAEGAVDVAVEPELSVWDVAALVPVVRRGRRPDHRAGRRARPARAAARSRRTGAARRGARQARATC